MRQLGLCVLDGGHHPGLGTANRVVPLGRQYLELLGVVDRAQAEQSDYGRALLRGIARGDRLVRWSLRTDDIDGVAARLAIVVERRQRLRPDGARLTWRAAGLALSLDQPWLPFFMQWDEPSQYPGAAPVEHPCGASHAAWLEVCPGDAAKLAQWTQGGDAPLRPVDGEPGLGRVALAGAEGVVLTLP
jgi:hypothetical protein